jgi:hypothetical protein
MDSSADRVLGSRPIPAVSARHFILMLLQAPHENRDCGACAVAHDRTHRRELRSPSRRLQECFLHHYLPESNPLIGREGLHNELLTSSPAVRLSGDGSSEVSCSPRGFSYQAFSGLPKFFVICLKGLWTHENQR